MQATGGSSAGFDLYDNGNGNTAINTLASNSTATISGRLNLRAGDNDPVGTIFTVADGSAATDLLVSGIVADTASQGVGSKIQKSGAGTMSLTGNNSYTGGTILNAGTLAVNSNTSLGASGGNLTFAGNSTFRTDASISSSRNYAISSGVTATIDTNGNALTNNGTISGSGGVTKAGNGTLTFSGTASYTGSTLVTSGTLVVNGSLASSSVIVSGGAKLGGSGTLTNTTIGGAGMVGPGSSPGIMTASKVDPSLGLGFDFEYTALGAPKWSDVTASNNDVMRLTNAVPFTQAMTSGNTLNFYLNVASLSASTSYQGGFFTDLNSDFLASVQNASKNYYVFGDGLGTDISYNGTSYYTLANYNAKVSGTFGINLTTLQVASADFATGAVTNGWTTGLNVVPEPATWALLAFSLTTVVVFRRRRSA